MTPTRQPRRKRSPMAMRCPRMCALLPATGPPIHPCACASPCYRLPVSENQRALLVLWCGPVWESAGSPVISHALVEPVIGGPQCATFRPSTVCAGNYLHRCCTHIKTLANIVDARDSLRCRLAPDACNFVSWVRASGRVNRNVLQRPRAFSGSPDLPVPEMRRQLGQDALLGPWPADDRPGISMPTVHPCSSAHFRCKPPRRRIFMRGRLPRMARRPY
ncbi:hypothetical protein BC834DRAFT_516164 [Gloeopeniophorella convolvens]|nr:hypothetical protein BC834DRAFT_516164 [Gloeopeniophorella convolvens]